MLTVYRDGSELKLTITFDSKPEEETEEPTEEEEDFPFDPGDFSIFPPFWG